MKNDQKSIETRILIHASQEVVWSILLDNSTYTSWNPFIVESKGIIRVGSKIKNTILSKGKPMHFTPRITKLIPNKQFEWLGRLFIPGIFDGRHYFHLHALDHQTSELVHGEFFSGWLSGIILKSIKADTEKGFKAMNEALKKRAEKAMTSSI